MKFKNCVQDRRNWRKVLRKPKLSTIKGSSAPEEEEEIFT
jgi:hypothetical protein